MKTKVLKVISIFLIILITTVIFTSCGSSKSSKAPSDSSSNETTTQDKSKSKPETKPITITYWQADTGGDIFTDLQVMADKYHEKNPNITVKVEALPGGDDLLNKARTAVMANQQPDILRDATFRLNTFYYDNNITMLNDFYTDEVKSKFVEEYLENFCKIGNDYWCIPEGVTFYGGIVNVDLFRAAGAEDLLPKDPNREWSRSSFEKACAAISKNNVYGTALYLKSESGDINMKMLLEGGQGLSLYTDNYTKTQYSTPRGIEGLKWIMNLVDKGYAVPNPTVLIDDDAWQFFANQEIGVLFCDTWARTWCKERMDKGEIEPFEIKVVNFPHEDNDKTKDTVYLTAHAVFDKGNPDAIKAAQDFILFSLTTDERVKNIKYQSFLPALSSQYDIYSDDPELDWMVNVGSKFVGDCGISSKRFPEVRTALNGELQAAFGKQKTPEQAMKDFDAKATEILSK